MTTSRSARAFGSRLSFCVMRSSDYRHFSVGHPDQSCSAEKANKTFCLAAASNAAKIQVLAAQLDTLCDAAYTTEFLDGLAGRTGRRDSKEHGQEKARLLQEKAVGATRIKRIDGDDYGTCLNCEEEMQQKRLEAVPWAKHCINCQEKAEKGQL